MRLPSEQDINVTDTLDEQTAVHHFLGRTNEEICARFSEPGMSHLYMEDYGYMGPMAFQYYLHGLVEYLMSSRATGDNETMMSFKRLLENRLADLEPVNARPLAIRAVRYILDNPDKFMEEGDTSSPEAMEYPQLLAKLETLPAHDGDEKR